MRPLSKTTSGLFLFGLENSFAQLQLIQLFNHMGNSNNTYEYIQQALKTTQVYPGIQQLR